jgi:putative acetyltransferase
MGPKAGQGDGAAVTLRPAEAADATAIEALFARTVREVNAADYSPAQIADWLGRQRPERLAEQIEAGRVLVAVEGDGGPAAGPVVAFGIRDGASLRALYVAADRLGRGIGSRLLARLEGEAAGEGVAVLEATSTLTAVAFYRARGYEMGEQIRWPAGADSPLEAVTFRKNLGRREGATRMRWTLRLMSPSLVADGDAVTLGPDETGRGATLSVRKEGDHVVLAVEARGPGSAVRPPHPEWYLRDHVAFLLNPGGDHATRWTCGVADDGTLKASAAWHLTGEEPGEWTPEKSDDSPPAAATFKRQGEGGFRVELRLPAGALWPEQGRAAGLRVKVGFHEEVIPPPLQWPGPVAWAGDAPLLYGGLYPARPPLRLEEMIIREPAWDETVHLACRLAVGPDGPREGTARAEVRIPGQGNLPQPQVRWRAAGDVAEASVPIVFPHRTKWANGQRNVCRFALEFADEAGRPLWRAEYPYGFDQGIIVRERYGHGGEDLPSRPEPEDPAFIEKFRRYVLARLPDYRPGTTRDGRDTDFCLEDVSGYDHLDLVEPDWPRRVARLLAERFGRWDDALCALSLWIHHPAVTRHSSRWAGISGVTTIRTLPRLGGCFCNDTARLGAALAEEVGRELGVELRGWSMGLRGHLCTLVTSPVGRVVIDGMMGLFYFTLDHTRLATLEEMRTEREIVERIWYAPRAHGHEFFHGNDAQIIRPHGAGSVEWPASARMEAEDVP